MVPFLAISETFTRDCTAIVELARTVSFIITCYTVVLEVLSFANCC